MQQARRKGFHRGGSLKASKVPTDLSRLRSYLQRNAGTGTALLARMTIERLSILSLQNSRWWGGGSSFDDVGGKAAPLFPPTVNFPHVGNKPAQLRGQGGTALQLRLSRGESARFE